MKAMDATVLQVAADYMSIILNRLKRTLVPLSPLRGANRAVPMTTELVVLRGTAWEYDGCLTVYSRLPKNLCPGRVFPEVMDWNKDAYILIRLLASIPDLSFKAGTFG